MRKAVRCSNFSVTQDPIGDKINIRGIFTSEVPSLEQSVSTFVDGVNRGRGTQARFKFLDLERVEVLRGPQGTLFGKNTVGGALNLTTRKPTTDLTASFNAGYEPELEATSFGGFLSGPLSESVRGRLVYAGSNQSEGFIENRFFDESTPTSQDNSVRGILDFDVTATTLLRVRAEYQDFDVDGQPFGLRTAGPLAPLLQSFGVSGGSFTETAIGQTPGGPLDIGSSGTMDGDSQEVAVTFKQDFQSGGSLEIIGAFSGLDFKRQIDVDFSPLDLVGFEDTEDYDQTSFSLRFLSSDQGRVRYVAGLYYQQVDLKLAGLTSFNTPASQAVFAPLCQAAGLSPADALQLSLASVGFMGLTAADAASQLARAGNAVNVNKLTYAVSLQWAINEQVNAYISTSSGFKAGGFNSGAFGPTPDQAEFDPEEVTSYELGVKTTLFNGTAQFNAAYFFTEIEDLQVAQFTGDASFIVRQLADVA